MAIQAAGVLAALQILDGLLARAGTISNLIKKAQAENRDVMAAELDVLAAADDAARAKLVAAIAAARGTAPAPAPTPNPAPTPPDPASTKYEDWVNGFGPFNGAPQWVIDRWNKEHGR